MTDTTSAAPSPLHCPFCGSDRLERSCITHDDVACLDCDALAPSLVAWNRRAQPTPPAVVEPLTDEQAKAVLWAEHLRWMHAAGLDTEGMRPTGEWLDHWLLYVRAIEAAHGIKETAMAKRTITIEVEEDEVIVALKRPEDGYEDVHPELVAEDAIKPDWPEYRTVWPKKPPHGLPT
jgi:hypothetical protein